MSARAPRESARKGPEKALQYGLNTLEFDETALRVSLDELLNLNSRRRGGYADLPLRNLNKPQFGVFGSSG
jgi:hypothetical protein